MENTNEIWKPVVGYENYYEVSNTGKVRGFDKIVNFGNRKRLIKCHILKGCINFHGYHVVSLSKNGKKTKHTVHRLVAEAFIQNPNNLPCINHKDEVKTNNHVSNLEWCTQKYNMDYSRVWKKSAESRSKPVIQLTLNGEFVNEYKSGWEAERQTGISQGNISSCCLGKYKSSGGYVWRYK